MSNFKRRSIALTLLAAVALLHGPVFSQDPPKKKDSSGKVNVKAVAGKIGADGTQTITLNLMIEKGWYIYANPVGNEDFKGNETTVKVSSKPAPADAKTTYPAGQKYDTYNVYKEQVMITTVVRRAAGDTAPLQLSIHVNSCSYESMICLLPGEIKLTVPNPQ
jgi:hypothetical protein